MHPERKRVIYTSLAETQTVMTRDRFSPLGFDTRMCNGNNNPDALQMRLAYVTCFVNRVTCSSIRM